MDNVNKTLYIPLYGKAYVSQKNIILKDKKAEELWEYAGIELKGKSKSKWLAYYMGMRAKVFDDFVEREINNYDCIIHVGCGLDSRVLRIDTHKNFYDIDFKEVIDERRKHYQENNHYHMIEADLRDSSWLKNIKENNALIIMEGVSMYLSFDELYHFMSSLEQHFASLCLFMDCYSEKAAKLSRYKNPINDVGVYQVYGLDDPKLLNKNNFSFIKEHHITPKCYIDELKGIEKIIFKILYGGRIAKSLYKLYEYRR